MSVKNKVRKKLFSAKKRRDAKVGAKKFSDRRPKKRAVLSIFPGLTSVRRRKIPPFRIIPEIDGVGKGRKARTRFFFSQFFRSSVDLLRSVACGAAFFAVQWAKKESGAFGTRRGKERRNGSWKRRRTENGGRFGASSRRRSSWFIRVRVGFATSESSRRRTAD